MKTTYIVIAIVVVLAVIGGIYYSTTHSPASATATSTAQTTAANPTPASAAPAPASTGVVTTVTTTTTTTPAPQSFTVNGNDTTADLLTISVPKGTLVTITFGADAQGTYHGGLDFRSSIVNTGTIAPGSTKTGTFTATSSFIFQPYWPATNIAKPYHITINVT